MGVYNKYPPEVHEFVKKWVLKLRDEDLAEACNQELGTHFTASSMKAFRSNYGYRNRKKQWSKEEYWKYQKRYPQGMYEFIRDNSWGVSSQEMADMVNAKFGTSWTQTGMKQFRQRHGIKSGVTGWYRKGHPPGNKGKTIDEYMAPEAAAKVRQTAFRKGHRPANELPVGTIVVRGNDKLIKVSDEGSIWERWKYLGRYIWEQNNGPIPKGMCITFRDGDNMNCELSNLMMVTREECAQLTHLHYRFKDPDLTDTALAVIRVRNKAKEIRKGSKTT